MFVYYSSISIVNDDLYLYPSTIPLERENTENCIHNDPSVWVIREGISSSGIGVCIKVWPQWEQLK